MEMDSLFKDAAEIVVSHRVANVPFLQRKLRLGYMRASRILLQLEVAKIISPFNGATPREILITKLPELESRINEILEQAKQ